MVLTGHMPWVSGSAFSCLLFRVSLCQGSMMWQRAWLQIWTVLLQLLRLLHEWGSSWRWGARKLTVHLRAPASGGDGVHVGRVLHPSPSSWLGPLAVGKKKLLILLIDHVFPETGTPNLWSYLGLHSALWFSSF